MAVRSTSEFPEEAAFIYGNLVLAIANFASLAGLTVLGGYIGILTALAAWYASAKGIFAATLVSKK
jgi:succinate-acetate transporter protein